jgi:hypothetical protein
MRSDICRSSVLALGLSSSPLDKAASLKHLELRLRQSDRRLSMDVERSNLRAVLPAPLIVQKLDPVEPPHEAERCCPDDYRTMNGGQVAAVT